MATVQPVRNIAPFINKQFTVVSKWWSERINPVTGETEIHRGLDITTGHNDTLYSMLAGRVLDKGNTSTAGNYLIIVDDTLGSPTYGYATRYLHMQYPAQLPIGARVQLLQAVGTEGRTGQATGIHLHLEMQDVSRFNWQWHSSYNKSDYLPCIAWGRNARFISNENVGKKLYITGRIQSRQYEKKIDENSTETRVAYEISF